MENVGIFYGHFCNILWPFLQYFMAIFAIFYGHFCNILWPFLKHFTTIWFLVLFVIWYHFGMLYQGNYANCATGFCNEVCNNNCIFGQQGH
jgi:hypothetical protein